MMSTWSEAIARLLRGPSAGKDELAAILYARGSHALAGGAALAEDGRVAALAAPPEMEAAALLPGSAALVRRLEQALPYLDDLDDSVAHEAEQATADVLDAADRWTVRARGLEALGLAAIASRVRGEHARFARDLEQHRGALSALGWMAEERRRRAPDPETSAWRLVATSGADRREAAPPELEDITDDDLALAALDGAPPDVRARLARALASSDVIRARYERFLELAPGFEDAWGARRDRQPPPVVRPVGALRLAAADRAELSYEAPADEALIHVFGDGSELYVEQDGEKWLVRLYRAAISADDHIEPLESRFEVRKVLGGLAEGGPITVRHAGETVTWEPDGVR